MKFRILFVLLIIGYTSQAQSTYSKWALEAGFGIHGSSKPYGMLYTQGNFSFPQVSIGGRYMFNESIGVRASAGYLSMNEGGDSREFDTDYFRGSLEGLLDLKHLLRVWDRRSPFTVIGHAGGGLSRAEFDNTGRSDNMLHFTIGAMPQYTLNDKWSLYGDISYFGHKSQSYTWEGEPGGGNGNAWTLSIGVVYNLHSERIPWARRIQRR